MNRGIRDLFFVLALLLYPDGLGINAFDGFAHVARKLVQVLELRIAFFIDRVEIGEVRESENAQLKYYFFLFDLDFQLAGFPAPVDLRLNVRFCQEVGCRSPCGFRGVASLLCGVSCVERHHEKVDKSHLARV